MKPNGLHANGISQSSANERKQQLVARDFRSDTITIPTQAMFDAMIQASRGDDVYEDDSTTNDFQKEMAELTGKEAALFCVSGTQTNQLAIRTHLKQPPHSVICDQRAHVFVYEAGGIAFHSQAQAQPIAPSNQMHLRWTEDIEPHLELSDNIHFCPTRLICLENTLSGTVFPQEEIEKISENCRRLGIPLHLDGARIFEVAAKTGKSLKELCQPFDTVSLCLSKGIGAPIGSILVGPNDFIKKTRHFRKLFGGGIRQCGPLVAAAKHSFDTVFPQLPRVHKLAARLAQALHQQGVYITMPVDTNMVFIECTHLGITTDTLIEAAAELKPYPITLSSTRLVLHHQISQEAIDDFVSLISDLKEKYKDSAKGQTVDPAKELASEAHCFGKHQETGATFAGREYGSK